MLRIKNDRLLILLLSLFAAAVAPQVLADHNVEDKLKVGFVYNFIKYTDWPEEKNSNTKEPITIGVIGSESFFGAFKGLENEKAKYRDIVVRHFAGFEKLKKSRKNVSEWNQKIEALKSSHVLVFSGRHGTAIKSIEEILEALEGSAILTIGERSDFLEKGGIINFLKEDKKIRFEINLVSARLNKLKVSVRLLQLAKRVIQKTPTKDAKN